MAASVNTLVDSLTRVLADVASSGFPCALVGGLAVSARAEPRMTRDIDLAVAVGDDRQAEKVVASLVARGYRVRALVEQESAGRLATARLMHCGDGEGIVDLLFASSGVEKELVAAADETEIVPGVVVPLATVGFLMALKLLARDDRKRPQDADDLRALMEVATPQDIVQCGAAVDLIVARGYGRGRDLRGAWAQWLHESGWRAP